jgi:hypothetical protein
MWVPGWGRWVPGCVAGPRGAGAWLPVTAARACADLGGATYEELTVAVAAWADGLLWHGGAQARLVAALALEERQLRHTPVCVARGGAGPHAAAGPAPQGRLAGPTPPSERYRPLLRRQQHGRATRCCGRTNCVLGSQLLFKRGRGPAASGRCPYCGPVGPAAFACVRSSTPSTQGDACVAEGRALCAKGATRPPVHHHPGDPTTTQSLPLPVLVGRDCCCCRYRRRAAGREPAARSQLHLLPQLRVRLQRLRRGSGACSAFPGPQAGAACAPRCCSRCSSGARKRGGGSQRRPAPPGTRGTPAGRPTCMHPSLPCPSRASPK